MIRIRKNINWLSVEPCEFGGSRIDFYDAESMSHSIICRKPQKRWRYPECFIGKYVVAEHIFDYEHPSDQEIRLMESVVDLVGRVLDHVPSLVENRVAEIRLRESERLAEMVRFSAREPEAELQSFIYLMSHRNGLTKIGLSKRPSARERTLQAEDPQLELTHTFEGDRNLENRLHRIFASKRVRGEWFELEPRHVRWIEFVLSN